MLVATIPQAVATGHCRVLPSAFASEITVDSRGKPDGVKVDRKNIETRVIVVWASVTETPRLLLNSRSKWHPQGIGNEHDRVGRNIENDGGLFVYGLFDRVVTDIL